VQNRYGVCSFDVVLLIVASLLSPRKLAFILTLLVFVFELIDVIDRKKIRRIVLLGTCIVLTVIAWLGP